MDRQHVTVYMIYILRCGPFIYGLPVRLPCDGVVWNFWDSWARLVPSFSLGVGRGSSKVSGMFQRFRDAAFQYEKHVKHEKEISKTCYDVLRMKHETYETC